MLFGKKYYYYAVRFDTEKTYWYRASSGGFRLGTKVIVPVTNNGKWEIGTVEEKIKCTTKDAPYPMEKTKGIVKRAGWFGNGAVRRHNKKIENSPYPPFDISHASVQTKSGTVEYITCRRERELLKRSSFCSGKRAIIENYPPVGLRDIPAEARLRLREKLRQIREAERYIDEEKRLREEAENERLDAFLEEMEELDQYS